MNDWTNHSKSFTSEIPDLRFHNNAQAEEFISDVASWNSGGIYFRFFNPLFYMHADQDALTRGTEGRYWYSYQVQRYAMEKVLQQRGVEDPSTTVRALIEKANTSNWKTRDELFVLARRHFREEDFVEVAKIYRRIGVALLKKMAPYYTG